MEFRIATVPLNLINTTAVACTGDRTEILRLQDRLQLRRPIIAVEIEGVVTAMSGGMRLYAHRELRIPNAECALFQNSPPRELLELSDEFDHKSSSGVVESMHIRSLCKIHGFQLTGIARILAASKQLICDIEKIGDLPQEILADAIDRVKFPKRVLIHLSRMKASKEEKIAAYRLALHRRRTASNPELTDITACIRKGNKTAATFRKASPTVGGPSLRQDLEDLKIEFSHLIVTVSQIVEEYDASYSQSEYSI